MSSGEDIHHHNTHHKIERKMTTTLLNKLMEKRGTLKYPANGIDALLMGGGTGGDAGTPRRPQSLAVDDGKINKLATQLIILFEQTSMSSLVDEGLISAYNTMINTNKSMILSFDEINSVNVNRHMALKMIKKEYWELRYGKIPLTEGEEYHNNNPSPKRELDEKNSQWEILNI